ncbi:hypothetical protein PIB30_061972 [Stylosanthes scabra]|uniref:Uncharacterized protein n=1 Tax=Stylosanthes scabra TaxID=79078 RepID=A0ABU6SLV2_9FABA|nr:hypothetical protein [Stylosanthes scabra]
MEGFIARGGTGLRGLSGTAQNLLKPVGAFEVAWLNVNEWLGFLWDIVEWA